jgi:hypothetical protein
MAIVITRRMVVPGWLLVCALVVILAPSATVATGLLLLSGLAFAANLLGRNTVQPVVADGLPTIAVAPLAATAVARPAVRRHSWPDSGFRNIGRGTKGG